MFHAMIKSIIVLIALTVTLTAQQNISYSSLNDRVPFDNSITTGKLDNGLTYFIKQNAKPEKRAELRILIKAGSILEDDDQKGLAHFVEHMLFNGTESFPKTELVSFLEKTGIRFGADLNASTGFDRTFYMLTLPTDDKELLAKGVQVLEEWAHKATFDNAEIDKERGVILEEWRLGRGASDRIMQKQLPKLLYKSRYADRLPIGDTAVFMNAPYENFKRYYRDWYRPDLMAVIAVGDFDKAEMEKLIREKFSRMAKHPNPKPRVQYDVPAHSDVIISVNVDKELPMSNVFAYYKHPSDDEGTFAAYRSSIMDQLISSMLNERLAEISRRQDPPFLGASGFKADKALGPISLFGLAAFTKDGNMLIGFDAVMKEGRRMVLHGFNESELERAKAEYLRGMETAAAEKDKTPSAAFAEELARHFEFGESVPGIDYELGLARKFIPDIKISEINEIARNLVQKGSLVITMSGPEKPGIKIPTETEVMDLYTSIMNEQLEPYKDEVSSTPLFTKEVVPGTVKSEKKIAELNVTELTLSNGVKLVLKPTDFKNDEIIMQAFSPGGYSLASDADLVSAKNASDIINEAGIAQLNLTTLEKMMKGKIANVSPVITDKYEGFSGSASLKDFETMLQLTHLYFTDPRLDYESYQVYFDRELESLINGKRQPESAVRDTFQAVMANYHHREKPWTEDLMKQMDADKAFDFYKDRFADASDFTFILVGSFKLDEIKPMLLKYLGSLPALNRKENFKDHDVKAPKGNVNKVVSKGIEKKSSVMIAITGDMEYNQKSRHELNSLIEVFNIKLREKLREDRGGVYGVRAFARMEKYPKPGYRISVMFGCNPDRVDELAKDVKDIIAEMKAQKPADDYILKTKNIQEKAYEVNLKENRFWLGTLFSYYYNVENPSEILSYPKLVQKLKADDIHKAAKKYFTENFVQVVLKPENQ